MREGLAAYDKRHGLQDGLKPPATADRKGRAPPAARRPLAVRGDADLRAAQGPRRHRDRRGRRRGDVRRPGRHGAAAMVRLVDYERYNPRGLAPSAVRRDRRARAREPARSGAGRRRRRPAPRWSRGPRGRSSPSTCGRGRSSRSSAATKARPERSIARRSRDGSPGRRSSRSSTRTPSIRGASRRRRSSIPTPDVFEGGYHPSNFEGWRGPRSLAPARGAREQRQRRRRARPAGRRSGERGRVGAARSGSSRR